MADTYSVTRTEQGTKQFQGAFSEMWSVADTLTGGVFKMLIGRPAW